MLFWIFVIILITSIATCAHTFYNCKLEVINNLAGFMTVVASIAVLVSLSVILYNCTGVDGYIAQMNARHEMLVYQLENDLYNNDDDLGKRELMIDIQKWNEDLARRQENQDDFWIGIYWPNIYDQFESIKLKYVETNSVT